CRSQNHKTTRGSDFFSKSSRPPRGVADQQGDIVIPFVDLKAQYQSIKTEIDRAIGTVVNNCHFILGSEVGEFEREFAKYVGVEHAVGTNNGTSALHLALLAAGVQPGDEVITVSCTFVATAAAVRYTNARPVYVDVTDDSYTMDPSKIEGAIT